MPSQKKSNRPEKLASLLQHLLADYFQKEMEMPGVVSITQIKVAPNFQAATVWLSIYAAGEREVLKAISANIKDLRVFLTHELKTKYIPYLSFKVDTSQEHAQRIAELIHDLSEKKDAN